MKITIHRGTHQIGGTITEIKTAKARLIIDMGTELPGAGKEEDDTFDIEGVTTGIPDCDGVMVTHYHGDHVGMFEKVLPEVPIFMGDTAKKIFAVVQDVLKKKLNKGNPELVAAFRTFSIGKPLYIKDTKITPIMADHSAFDAYMLLIEAEGKKVLHTGDFRMHGAKGRSMPLMLQKYVGNIDVLITEGTMLSRTGEKVMTQQELTAKAKELVHDHKNVFVLCSSTNIDSIASFYHAAIECKKPFIVCEDDFQAEILRVVTKNSRSPFYNFGRQKVYVYRSYNKRLHDYMNNCGFCMMARVNYTTEKAIAAFPDNLLIHSMWDGYLDKKRLSFDERRYSFVEKAKAAGSRFVSLHTSGHATAEDIKRVCEITKPKIIMPIHSEQPEAFTHLGLDSEIRLFQDGESLII